MEDTVRSDAEYTHLLLQRARDLRKNQTPAEAVLWQRLRGRKNGGFKWYRQKVLHEYIVDFYNHDCQIVIEVDGAVHEEPEQRQRDLHREDQLLGKGYRILRFSNEEVLNSTEDVCASILRHCKERTGTYRRRTERYRNQHSD